MYVPQAVAYHIGSATTGSMVHPRILELVTRNQLWLLAKDYPPAVIAPVLVLGYCCFRRCGSVSWFAIGGLAAYIRGIRGALAKRSAHATRSARSSWASAESATPTSSICSASIRTPGVGVALVACRRRPGRAAENLLPHFRSTIDHTALEDIGTSGCSSATGQRRARPASPGNPLSCSDLPHRPRQRWNPMVDAGALPLCWKGVYMATAILHHLRACLN